MLWAQSGASFVVWVAGGLILARLAANRWLPRMSHKARASFGPLALVGGLVVLVGGLWASWSAGGIKGGALLPLPWTLATVTGVAFTALQTFGALCLLSASRRPETQPATQPSEPQENR